MTSKDEFQAGSAAAPIRFGGKPRVPSPEVFADARRNQPPWFQVLRQACFQVAKRPESAGHYADPDGTGATLEQIWNLFTLLGVQTWCVLVRMMPADQVAGIGRLLQSSPAELVDRLKRLQKLSGTLNVTTLHYDGATGHCVRLKHHDSARDRFVYHDPWPGRSLLCAENNEAGVDAKADEDGSWSVTAGELERVLFASFLLPQQYARLEGVAFDLLYETWRAGTFYSFFRLNLVDQRTEGGLHRRLFQAGPFKDAVTLIVDSEDGGRITNASLLLAKQWMADQLPLAVDIGKSFVGGFAPLPERALYDDISRTVWSIPRNPGLIRALLDADDAGSLPDGMSRQAADVVLAFVGAAREARVESELASLTVRTPEDNDGVLALDFHLY